MTELSGIIRRPDFAGGGLTEEERERMAAHSSLWVERAFRTEPADPHLIETAIKGVYQSANLAEPRVILVPSPFVMALAGGIASLWWYLFENKLLTKQRGASCGAATYDPTGAATFMATRAAINVAIDDATDDATSAASLAETYDPTRSTVVVTTYAATHAATRAATIPETYAATRDATLAPTRDATTRATYDATRDATHLATRDATHLATRSATYKSWRALAASFVSEEWAQAALEAAQRWSYHLHAGNMSGPWECHLTAYRDVLGLRLPVHEAYKHWEQAAINGGFRWMHHRFCLVSDFPEILSVNARNQPHAEFGPSHRWRDGFSIWHLNGVKVEQWMAESHPDDIDARKVLTIENVDQRRELIRRMGMERVIGQLRPTVLDVERREVGGEYRLLAVDMNHGEPWRFLQMVNQSTGAVHIEAVPRECETVRHGLNWRASQNIDHDWYPNQLT
jgi:hypothetical protein